MQKNAPSLGRILSMVIFTLTCFGLFLFLWLSFGGAVPLQAKRYVLKMHVPEATTLAQEADVRIAGVNVGKVRDKQLDKRGNSTTVTLQIDPQYAPVPKDARAILRQKTLLGETYVELTPGNRRLGTLKDGSTLAKTQIEPTVELDEILRIFDEPTKAAFRAWVKESADQIKGGGGQDLNSALGNLGDFAQSGAGVLKVLNTQHAALQRVVKNTGVVFAALNQRYGQLHDLVVNSHATFSATAAEQVALARTFEIFPTFLDESRTTLARLETFATNTHPLVNSLKPVADDLGPTVRDLGKAAPDLENLFRRLNPVIDAAPRTLPQAARFLRGAKPLFGGLHTFLPEFNPILSYANYAQTQLGGFLGNGAAALYYKLPREANNIPRYMLGFAGAINDKSLGVQQGRPQFDRGNAYPAANVYPRSQKTGAIESFDCKPDHPQGNGTTDPVARRDPVETTGPNSSGGSNDLPPCFVEPPDLWDGLRYSNVLKGKAPLVPAPFKLEGTKPVPTPQGP
ncbi:MAG: phospholipid/cholesterol/gamma-HCH transport system substrate-binding protein [Thermoleophilaceae bacterium]|nr:phospholipid/cholesterol/gamma-HCH transport system substrate-binding protein [Thermoleophilaceae bacterium]